jgi:hypothetical protein
MHPVHTFTPCFPKSHYSIILPSRSPNGLFPSGFPTKILYAFLIYTMRATFSTQFILLHLITLIICGEAYKLWRYSLWSLLHSSTISSLLCPNILFSTLLSNALNLCSSRSVRDQVPHPYKTTGKIIVLYISIFKFFYRRGGKTKKKLWAEWEQAFPEFNLLLISSWMRFSFVTFVPKYLNFATFSKDL